MRRLLIRTIAWALVHCIACVGYPNGTHAVDTMKALDVRTPKIAMFGAVSSLFCTGEGAKKLTLCMVVVFTGVLINALGILKYISVAAFDNYWAYGESAAEADAGMVSGNALTMCVGPLRSDWIDSVAPTFALFHIYSLVSGVEVRVLVAILRWADLRSRRMFNVLYGFFLVGAIAAVAGAIFVGTAQAYDPDNTSSAHFAKEASILHWFIVFQTWAPFAARSVAKNFPISDYESGRRASAEEASTTDGLNIPLVSVSTVE